MSDHRARLDAVGLHRCRDSDLHGEQRGLDAVDTGHRLGRRHRLGDREPGFACDQRLQFSDAGSERRLSGQKFGAHGRPLRTLAGEHPHRSAINLAHRFRIRNVAACDFVQTVDQAGEIRGEHRGTHRPVPAPTGQRVRQIGGHQSVRMLLNPVGQTT